MHTKPVLSASVTGVVLAGGRGLRMNGRDKGLIERDGRTLAERQLEHLRRQTGALIISANRNLDRYRAMGVPVVADAQSDGHGPFAGPLAGMLSALRAAHTPWIACLPCDTLGTPADLVRRLLDGATAAGARAAYAVDAHSPQYAVCLLHVDLADALDATLRTNQRAVHAFLSAQHAVAVDFADCAFENLNTPEMLAC
ncbi:MAG: molybdenum cofactor guanylyltransferase MobA [Sinimarinibacterium sp.]|jgi:molybdopterin-guanine dinucleotide biosynthesis protein A